MKVVKINAVWCSGCLIMNKTWKKILEKYDIETENLDYDLDYEKVEKYKVGEILPVLIFYKGDVEVKRIVGEASVDELSKVIEGVGI